MTYIASNILLRITVVTGGQVGNSTDVDEIGVIKKNVAIAILIFELFFAN